MILGVLHKKRLLCGIMIVFIGMLLVWGCQKAPEVVSSGKVFQAVNNGFDVRIEETVEIEASKKEEEEVDAAELEMWSRPKVKGIFVTGAMAGTDHMEDLISLVEQTELNAMVIDVKNDEGRVTFDMDVPFLQEKGICKRYIRDIQTLVKKCKEKNIYLIARIVAFKDPYMEQVKPEWCVHNMDGSLFKDKNGMTWLDPHNQQVWEYLLDIAQEALHFGFDEIQFDYMRFSTDSNMKNVDFEQVGEDRRQVITEFVKYASGKIHEAGGAVSADVYGVVIDSSGDQEIVGQDYLELSRYLDYISPMVYPSHYGPYNYNIPIPDAEPYRLVLAAMQSSRKVLAGVPINDGKEELASLEPLEGVKARVRPWLQDFTATWVKGHIPYGDDEIRAQIQAVYDAGYEEWILWNATNKYTDEGLMKEE